jgi:hypothetical protein
MGILSTKAEEWMAKPFVDSPWFYADKWSFFHLSSGISIGLVVRNLYRPPLMWLIVFLGLVMYELFERLTAPYTFRVEKWYDTVWDVVTGMAGVALVLVF